MDLICSYSEPFGRKDYFFSSKIFAGEADISEKIPGSNFELVATYYNSAIRGISLADWDKEEHYQWNHFGDEELKSGELYISKSRSKSILIKCKAL